jgi:hypothetical protein
LRKNLIQHLAMVEMHAGKNDAGLGLKACHLLAALFYDIVDHGLGVDVFGLSKTHLYHFSLLLI